MSKCKIGAYYVEREDAIEVLRLARETISSGRKTFICNALLDIRDESLQNAADAVKGWVIRQLDGEVAYQLWVKRKCPHIDISEPLNPLAREGRIAWIDWMIAELQKELDSTQPVGCATDGLPSIAHTQE